MVRDSRGERGMTQHDLAERVGRSQEWVGKVELGEIKTPGADAVRRLSDVLGIDVADIYIAMGRARTKADARRVADSVASLPGRAPLPAAISDIWEAMSPDDKQAWISLGKHLAKKGTGSVPGAGRERETG